MDNLTWILVADSTKAKIYGIHKARLIANVGNGKDLQMMSEHTHPESRKLDQELVSDRQGKFGKGTFVEHTDPKRHLEEMFAIELARVLEKARSENKFHDIILIAPSVFMGLLNKHLHHETSKLVSLKIEKDYTGETEKTLVAHLADHL